jgi:hypothetical protein
LLTVKGVNAEDIGDVCKNAGARVSSVGCTIGDVMYLNADRDVKNIAPTIQHELQHWWGHGEEGKALFGRRGPYGEECANRREAYTMPVFGTVPDKFRPRVASDPTVNCALGI